MFGGQLHFPLCFALVYKHSDTYSAKDHQPSPLFAHVLIKDGGAVGVEVKALRYKPAGRGFDSRWFHWNFSVT